MTRPVRGIPSRFSPRLGAHLVSCSQCDTVLRLDRATVGLELLALEAAGWRRKRGAAVCPTCARPIAPEPRTPRPSVPYDPSLARATLRAYAGTATGETRRWALILLREWGGDEIDGQIPTKLAKSTDPP